MTHPSNPFLFPYVVRCNSCYYSLLFQALVSVFYLLSVKLPGNSSLVKDYLTSCPYLPFDAIFKPLCIFPSYYKPLLFFNRLFTENKTQNVVESFQNLSFCNIIIDFPKGLQTAKLRVIEIRQSTARELGRGWLE